jgi:phage terminase large subunit GpA-like protein
MKRLNVLAREPLKPPHLRLNIHPTLQRNVLLSLAPPPTLTISEWADRERYLSPESAAEPGRWSTSRAEYQRGVMDAISDPRIETVVIMKGSQVGYTEILANVCGYHIDQDPCPILVIQPSLELAETWSKDRLSPMIRDTPTLRKKVSEVKARDSDNTIRQKIFPGGRLTIIGANAPRGLAARPIRVIVADEVDGYGASAGTEGDPLKLAAKRQITFWNRKSIIGSTPVLKETSLINREWLLSDQRRFYVPCPQCDHAQVLVWSNVRWDKDAQGNHQADTAHYVCEACGAVWTDVDRWDAINKGQWRAEAVSEAGIVGFHIPGFLSPWLTLEKIVREFLNSRHDPESLKVWTNTVLGEPWEEGESVDPGSMTNRGESYGPDDLPDGIRLLVAGVDVQSDRIEVQILGFGQGEECWAVGYDVVHGSPSEAPAWNDLDRLLLEKYTTETGRILRIRAACVDSGGHHANQVFDFCRPRRPRRIFAIKGVAGPKPIWPKRAVRGAIHKRDEVFLIGVDTAKDALYGRIRIPRPGPGYIHFPVGAGFDRAYFDQLTAEKVQTRKREGRPYRVWILPSGKRNEALDTFVYALAARMSIPVRLDRAAEAPSVQLAPIDQPEEPELMDSEPVAPPPTAPRPGVPKWARPQPWLGGSRKGWFDR